MASRSLRPKRVSAPSGQNDEFHHEIPERSRRAWFGIFSCDSCVSWLTPIPMSAIDEGIVREYFEQNGFLVRQARKYQVSARRKVAEEEIDLIVFNPSWQRGARSPDSFLFSNELPNVHKAIVAVKGWHTRVFTPNMLK